MFRVLPMMDNVVGEEGNYQEDKGPGQDGHKDKGKTRMTLHPDQGSRTAWWVSGMGYVHQENCNSHPQAYGKRV